MKAWDLKMHRSDCAWLYNGFLLNSLREKKMKNIVVRIALLAAVVALGIAPMAHAQIYINDGTLSNFTGPITSYATFSNYSGNTGCTAPTFTPDSTELLNTSCRVFGGTLTGTGLSGSNNWIEATFPRAVSTIVVFPNMDHFGSAYDGYQYTIAGSNDGTNWTVLFDATGVSNSGEPFTLTSFTGTGPLFVNKVLTPQTPPGGGLPASCSGTATPCQVGYIAFFDFGTAYKYYAFGASTVAFAQGNADQELSAVGTGLAAITVPLQGNGFTNAFPFGFATYNVIYPADVSVPANTTMTISPNVLAPADCTSAINTPAFESGEPTCTTFTGTTPTNFAVIYDVACSLNGAPSTSAQCPKTTGFDPFVSGAVHSSEDISNILAYTVNNTPAGEAPQMLTAPEGSNAWVAYGVGFQFDCCTRGSGGSNYNSQVVAADFPATVAATFAIPAYNFVGFAPPVANQPPNQTQLVLNVVKAGSTVPLKWQLFYPTAPSLGFNGGPVTNLNFPPNGYLSIQETPIACPNDRHEAGEDDRSSAEGLLKEDSGRIPSSSVIGNALPLDIQSNTGLINEGNGAYRINWKTSKSMADTCARLTLNTGDGQNHIANFRFK